jgi:hypothetical protein
MLSMFPQYAVLRTNMQCCCRLTADASTSVDYCIWHIALCCPRLAYCRLLLKQAAPQQHRQFIHVDIEDGDFGTVLRIEPPFALKSVWAMQDMCRAYGHSVKVVQVLQL